MTRRKRTKLAGEPERGTADTVASPPLPPEVNEVQLDLSLASPSDDESMSPPEAAPTDPPETFDKTVETAAETAEDERIETASEYPVEHLRGLLEALVFAADKPMTTSELARMASAPLGQVRTLLGELRAHYSKRGIVLDEIAGGWLFRTNVQFAPFVRELTSDRPVKLTRAQIETLAITAYRQPITRPEIDEIRGVDSGATLKLLLERELVRILGKKDEPGRPLLYGTTPHFLEFFSLKSLKDLPTLREFTELSDESRRVAEAELGDVLPEHAENEAERRIDDTTTNHEPGDPTLPAPPETADTVPPSVPKPGEAARRAPGSTA